jgi:chemotaxis protein MotB
MNHTIIHGLLATALTVTGIGWGYSQMRLSEMENRTGTLQKERDGLKARLSRADEANRDLKQQLSAARRPSDDARELKHVRRLLQVRDDEIEHLQALLDSNDKRLNAHDEELAALRASLDAEEEANRRLQERLQARELACEQLQQRLARQSEGGDGDTGRRLRERIEAEISTRFPQAGQGPAGVNGPDAVEVTGGENQSLIIRIDDRVLFRSGESVLLPSGRQALLAVSAVLNRYPEYDVRVEGHTDNVPVGSGLWDDYLDNWGLSAARALAAVRYLADFAGVDARRLSATGYGEYRPVASNETEQGQARNRRIEIVLSPPADPARKQIGLPAANEPVQPRLHGAAWLLDQPREAYGIQLLWVRAKPLLMRFLREHPLPGPLSYYRAIHGDSHRWGLVYGAFGTVADARAEMERLGGILPGVKPWIRPFGDIQEQIRTAYTTPR